MLKVGLSICAILGMLAMSSSGAGASSGSGAWSVSPSPNQGSHGDRLEAVSCPDTDFCVAVGYYEDSKTLIETWNGSRWSITPSPDPSNSTNVLRGVSCVTSSFCVAAGSFFSTASRTDRTLVLTWNGQTWSVAHSPSSGGGDYHLLSVSCTETSDCVAVGFYANPGVIWSLIETWNGTKWSITPNPNKQNDINHLTGVSCTGGKYYFCEAVGYFENHSEDSKTLTETWNGASWSITPSPDKGSSDNSLSSVACTSRVFCITVGDYASAATLTNGSLIEQWNGSAWSISSSISRVREAHSLDGVSCAEASSCVAVGSLANPAITETLIETWNGEKWSVTSSPNRDRRPSDYLEGASCRGSTFCEAVGRYNNSSGASRTLVETR